MSILPAEPPTVARAAALVARRPALLDRARAIRASGRLTGPRRRTGRGCPGGGDDGQDVARHLPDVLGDHRAGIAECAAPSSWPRNLVRALTSADESQPVGCPRGSRTPLGVGGGRGPWVEAAAQWGSRGTCTACISSRIGLKRSCGLEDSPRRTSCSAARSIEAGPVGVKVHLMTLRGMIAALCGRYEEAIRDIEAVFAERGFRPRRSSRFRSSWGGRWPHGYEATVYRLAAWSAKP